ncbi:MAG: ion channel [Hyphomicrobiaceae bacterium]|nr:ion channel [Hyphomicrobiaceae bacterium]
MATKTQDKARKPLRERLRDLYEGNSQTSHRFRYGLLLFDLLTVLFVVVTSFVPRTEIVERIDVLVGILLALDIGARFAIARKPLDEFKHPSTWADMVALASFLAPITGEGFAFLRILRTLRLLHTFQILRRLRSDSDFFRRNEEVVIAVAHLFVFIFVMTGIVYETQFRTNPQIANYVDALYFTITSLTTTGYGDVTLPGSLGRLISVAIMIAGVTLFLRLAQVLFRPHKVRFPCPDCGLQRHDQDAVHCKACGRVLCIPDEGL